MTKLLQTRIAFLEHHVDLLETEQATLNELLISCGFADGIKTLKSTVEELLASDESEHRPTS